MRIEAVQLLVTGLVGLLGPMPCAADPPETLRYDEAAWLCTHNAMNNAADGWRLPNQTKDLRGQFADGARAFMLDVHVQDGALVLRHGPEAARLLGWKPLDEGLAVLHDLLEKNPRAVVTVILESYAPAADVAAAFTAAGLEPYAHAQPAGRPWPTLGSMIAGGKRLVLFTDRARGGPPWQMDVWQHAWETPFTARTPADLRNVPNRGRRANPLLILNHFCADPLPSRRLAAQVNANPFLAERVAAAREAFDRKPNFLVVDFHEVGDALAVVRGLNRGR